MPPPSTVCQVPEIQVFFYRGKDVLTIVEISITRTGSSILDKITQVTGLQLASFRQQRFSMRVSPPAGFSIRRRVAAAVASAALEYRVLDSVDGSSALRVLQGDENIDVLFTDIVMPGAMNGLELYRHARKIRPELKVIFATGYSDAVVTEEAAGDMGGPMLRKPYNLSNLAQTLSSVLA